MTTIYQTKDIILKWIYSAETSEQCDLLLEILYQFIIERFRGVVGEHEMELVKRELMDALTDQKTKIVWEKCKPQEPEAPTLFLHTNNAPVVFREKVFWSADGENYKQIFPSEGESKRETNY